MKKNNIHNIATLFLLFIALGCTKLNEKVIDEVLSSDKISAENAIAAAYGQLGNGTFVDHGNVFALQEYSTDECLLPTRGSDWGDGGKWRAMHEFTWGADNAVLTTTWNNLTGGITKTLTAISAINDANASTFPNKNLFMAEARGLLAFYMYHTFNLFNQAPYRDPYQSDSPLEIKKADTAIDGLIKEVEAIIPALANSGEQSTYNARFTKQAAYALLADMYLNRAVLKDPYNAISAFNFSEPAVDNNGTDMDKVIYYTSLLINSGKYSLEKNYFHNFDIDNGNGSELIFVVAQSISNDRSGDNDYVYMSMERSQKPSPANRGTNASCITPEFYHTWDNNHDDPRFHRHYQYSDGTWFMNDGTDVSVPATSIVKNSNNLPWFHFNRGLQVGQQYGPTILSNGNFEMVNSRIKVNKLFTEKNTTLPADFTPELNFDKPSESVFTQNQINRGVRVFKFEFDPEAGNGSSNVDISLYRLGGIYTMRAEAYFRKGNAAAALADMNILRTSRNREALYNNVPGKAIASINEAVLYNEIGFEMYWEMYRRKQMIRFGKFDLPGTAKPQSEPYKRIYPIPQSTLDASDAFVQNQGYQK